MEGKYFRYSFKKNEEIKIVGGLFAGQAGIIEEKKKLKNQEGKTANYEYQIKLLSRPNVGFTVTIRHDNLKPAYEEPEIETEIVNNESGV